MKEPDYYRLEFDCNTETGIGTFDFQEKVHIIGLGDYNILDGGTSLLNVLNIIGNLESGDQEEPAIIAGDSSDILYRDAQEPFRLYKDPGYVMNCTTGRRNCDGMGQTRR